MRRVIPICLLSLSLLAPKCIAHDAPLGPGYAHSPSMHALLRWERFPLLIFFPASRFATRERRSLVLAGFDEWVRATHGVVCYRIISEEASADLTVTFSPHIAAPGSSHVGGLTTLTRTGEVLKKAAMSLTERDEDPAGFQATAAHEFGHALGIDGHSDDPGDIMFPVMTFSQPTVRNEEIDPPLPVRSVTRRDVNTLQSAYPGLVFTLAKR